MNNYTTKLEIHSPLLQREVHDMVTGGRSRRSCSRRPHLDQRTSEQLKVVPRAQQPVQHPLLVVDRNADHATLCTQHSRDHTLSSSLIQGQVKVKPRLSSSRWMLLIPSPSSSEKSTLRTVCQYTWPPTGSTTRFRMGKSSTSGRITSADGGAAWWSTLLVRRMRLICRSQKN